MIISQNLSHTVRLRPVQNKIDSFWSIMPLYLDKLRTQRFLLSFQTTVRFKSRNLCIITCRREKNLYAKQIKNNTFTLKQKCRKQRFSRNVRRVPTDNCRRQTYEICHFALLSPNLFTFYFRKIIRKRMTYQLTNVYTILYII